MKNHYKHGGERTPLYYCYKCERGHTKHSKIGKEHLNYKNE